MHVRIGVVLLVCAPALASGFAGAPADSRPDVDLSDGLTVTEAVRLALRHDPDLAALRRGRAAAEGAVAEARLLKDPELRTGRLNLDDDGGFRLRNYDLALRWSPPRWRERVERTREAQSRVREIEAEIAAAEQRLAAEVRLLHTEIVFLDEQIRLAEAALAVRDRMVRVLEAQVEAGARKMLDHTLAELALADARSVPAGWRLERRLRLARLAAKVGLPGSQDLMLQAGPELLTFKARLPEADGLADSAKAARAELEAISARCEQARSVLRLRRRQRYPWFSFLQLNREFGLRDAANVWGFRFGIELPVFQWRGAVLLGPQGELEQCRLELEAAGRRISLEVEELLERLRASSAELESYLEQTEPAAGRAVELAAQAVEAGQADLLERLSAEARYLEQRQTFLRKLLEHRRLEIELDRALGRAIPR